MNSLVDHTNREVVAFDVEFSEFRMRTCTHDMGLCVVRNKGKSAATRVVDNVTRKLRGSKKQLGSLLVCVSRDSRGMGT